MLVTGKVPGEGAGGWNSLQHCRNYAGLPKRGMHWGTIGNSFLSLRGCPRIDEAITRNATGTCNVEA